MVYDSCQYCVVVGYTLFNDRNDKNDSFTSDSHSHYAIMIKAKNPFYVFLSYINTYAASKPVDSDIR